MIEWLFAGLNSVEMASLPWAVTPAVVSFEGFPAPEEFGPLMMAFAERRAGPG